MPGILTPILGGLRRWKGGPASEADAPAPSRTAASRRVARGLADAIDRAMALGFLEHADKLAATAAGLAPGYPRLAEPLARLRLAQGDPETALSIIDGCRALPASLRLLRATCLLLLGARAEAQIDLQRWSGRSSAPLDARLLLGLLQWQDGDDASAIRTLVRNLKHLEDPRTLQALVLISVHRRQTEQAQVWAQRLRDCSAAAGSLPDVDMMLQSLGMAGVEPDAEPTPEQVNALAMELITFEPAIGVLTESQRRRPHPPTARLIRRAIQQALPDLADKPAAIEALARISLVVGELDPAAARTSVIASIGPAAGQREAA